MNEKLWTRDFMIDTIINFLLYVIFYQLMLWSTKFAIVTWNASISEAGLASGIFIIGGLSARIITGHVIDITGRKKLLLLGNLVKKFQSGELWEVGVAFEGMPSLVEKILRGFIRQQELAERQL